MGQSETETVLRTAELARLAIEPDEAERLGEQFARILAAFEAISRLDVSGVEPMTRATRLVDVKREDRPQPSLPLDEALRNAPRRIESYYGVPKTIGGEG